MSRLLYVSLIFSIVFTGCSHNSEHTLSDKLQNSNIVNDSKSTNNKANGNGEPHYTGSIRNNNSNKLWRWLGVGRTRDNIPTNNPVTNLREGSNNKTIGNNLSVVKNISEHPVMGENKRFTTVPVYVKSLRHSKQPKTQHEDSSIRAYDITGAITNDNAKVSAPIFNIPNFDNSL